VAQQHLGAGIKQESSQITSVWLAPNVPIITTGEAGPPEPNPPFFFFWKIRGNSSQQARKSTLKFEFRLANTRACIREATTIIESREFNHVNLYRSKVIHAPFFSLSL